MVRIFYFKYNLYFNIFIFIYKYSNNKNISINYNYAKVIKFCRIY